MITNRKNTLLNMYKTIYINNHFTTDLEVLYIKNNFEFFNKKYSKNCNLFYSYIILATFKIYANANTPIGVKCNLYKLSIQNWCRILDDNSTNVVNKNEFGDHPGNRKKKEEDKNSKIQNKIC
ncbi:hypothetical protein EDEG_02318 [Edhazardia aedis USNM 41457]|uniref:Uncharacterized protein n=1 Tax=Edhazardia aedis (strain USNM 41457) TaxID=1003232 RepID=J9D6B6_EDHAE|nr:hypothetical protein EDEG_02318 [Edhazardia aedis USNM 41457]|eukprot:EJW03341.1 hypothetical protein EDEG_02318 [Edhazardia aedis USNM 41457]